MKRFHLHLSVNDLDESILFYSTLFAAEPTIREADYAKWMLDDPRLNFAISMRGRSIGVDHVGVQVDTDEELRGMHAQLEAADRRLVQEDEQPCCYARSDKYWITDPSGIAWETFHTLGNIPIYGVDRAAPNRAESTAARCCSPAANAEPQAKASNCCA